MFAFLEPGFGKTEDVVVLIVYGIVYVIRFVLVIGDEASYVENGCSCSDEGLSDAVG